MALPQAFIVQVWADSYLVKLLITKRGRWGIVQYSDSVPSLSASAESTLSIDSSMGTPNYAQINCDQDSLVHQAVEGYDQFQRSYLPDRIRELLEAECETNPDFRNLRERLDARLPDIIREGQRMLFETYRHLQRPATSPSQTRLQQTSPANVPESEMPPETKASALPRPSTNAPSPLAAFRAPPNIDTSMDLNEVQQVHNMSDQQRNPNSDSGYGGSALVDSQQSQPSFDPDNGKLPGDSGMDISDSNDLFPPSYDFLPPSYDISELLSPQSTSFDPLPSELWTIDDTGWPNFQEPGNNLPDE
ncbi:hypothetical protein SLS54_009172 [Diplodia seriata]